MRVININLKSVIHSNNTSLYDGLKLLNYLYSYDKVTYYDIVNRLAVHMRWMVKYI